METTIDFATFRDGLARVAPAVSKDPDRPVLQFVHIYATKTRLRIEAADGFRAHFQDLPWSGPAFDGLLDEAGRKALLGIKVSKKDPQTLGIDIETGQILINGKPIARLQSQAEAEGRYPEINQVIPRNPQGWVTVFPVPFLKAVRTARTVSHLGSNVVRFHFTDTLILEARDEDFGESYTQVSLKDSRVTPRVIGFNADFWIDLLKVAGTAAVKIELSRPGAPALVTTGDGLQCVVMPMNVEACPVLNTLPEARESVGTSYVWPSSLDPWDVREVVNGAPAPDWYTPSKGWDEERHNPFPYEIREDIFTSHPEEGAVETEIRTIWAEVTEPRYGKGTKLAVLHIVEAIPAEGTVFGRQPQFASDEQTIGECDRCGDGPHWRIHHHGQDICKACYLSELELARVSR